MPGVRPQIEQQPVMELAHLLVLAVRCRPPMQQS
jgi:hypothetical protein